MVERLQGLPLPELRPPKMRTPKKEMFSAYRYVFSGTLDLSRGMPESAIHDVTSLGLLEIAKLALDLDIGDLYRGIRTVERTEGLVQVDGREVKVRSDFYDYSGTFWLGGEVLTKEEIEDILANDRASLRYLAYRSKPVIRTSSGRLAGFNPDTDYIIDISTIGK